MSAERLREAAALMRERAEGAAHDLGEPAADPRTWRGIGTGYREAIKDQIASWHPAVAVAVADWLDGATCGLHCGTDGLREPYCSLCEDSGGDHECRPRETCRHTAGFRHALAVANAYLGTADA